MNETKPEPDLDASVHSDPPAGTQPLIARIRELETRNAHLEKIGQEFIWGENNPDEWESQLEKAEKRARAWKVAAEILSDEVGMMTGPNYYHCKTGEYEMYCDTSDAALTLIEAARKLEAEKEQT